MRGIDKSDITPKTKKMMLELCWDYDMKPSEVLEEAIREEMKDG